MDDLIAAEVSFEECRTVFHSIGKLATLVWLHYTVLQDLSFVHGNFTIVLPQTVEIFSEDRECIVKVPLLRSMHA